MIQQVKRQDTSNDSSGGGGASSDEDNLKFNVSPLPKNSS